MINFVVRAVQGIELFLFSLPVTIDNYGAAPFPIKSYAHIEFFKFVNFFHNVNTSTQKSLRPRLWAHKNFAAHISRNFLDFLWRVTYMYPALEPVLTEHS